MASSSRSIRFNIFSRATVIRLRRGYGGPLASGYRSVRVQTKASLKKTTWAASFWRVGWDFRAALRAKSEYASHLSESRSHSRIFNCVKFYQRLRPGHSNKMAQLIFDIAGHCNRVGNFLSQ